MEPALGGGESEKERNRFRSSSRRDRIRQAIAGLLSRCAGPWRRFWAAMTLLHMIQPVVNTNTTTDRRFSGDFDQQQYRTLVFAEPVEAVQQPRKRCNDNSGSCGRSVGSIFDEVNEGKFQLACVVVPGPYLVSYLSSFPGPPQRPDRVRARPRFAGAVHIDHSRGRQPLSNAARRGRSDDAPTGTGRAGTTGDLR